MPLYYGTQIEPDRGRERERGADGQTRGKVRREKKHSLLLFHLGEREAGRERERARKGIFGHGRESDTLLFQGENIDNWQDVTQRVNLFNFDRLNIG